MDARSPNFQFLSAHDPLLLRYCVQAERYFAEDPNTCLIKLRQFAEALAEEVAALSGLYQGPEEGFADLLGRLKARGLICGEANELFHSLRKAGNLAAHGEYGTHREALRQLRAARALAGWFHRSFGADPGFRLGAFVPPPDPGEAETAVHDALERLREQLAAEQAEADEAQADAQAADARKARAEAEARAAYAQLEEALSLAEESEEQLAAERARFTAQLRDAQARAHRSPEGVVEALIQRARQAAEALAPDETEARHRVDAALREAGWEADHEALTHGGGARPEAGRARAIAGWPSAEGPADQVLFIGMTAVAVAETRHHTLDLPGALEQATRQGRGLRGLAPPPFVFAANGRPPHPVLLTRSGLWFDDLRQPEHLPERLPAWPSPAQLTARLAEPAAPVDGARPYQRQLLAALEGALGRTARVTMVSGSGRTWTTLRLLERLARGGHIRRALLLVERDALIEELERGAFAALGLRTLPEGPEETEWFAAPLPGAELIVTTDAGLGAWVAAGAPALPPRDQFDLLVVDDCGDAAARQLFDAPLLAVTGPDAASALPELGRYGLREAVRDGVLLDHEPAIVLRTALSERGLRLTPGQDVTTVDPAGGEVSLTRVAADVCIGAADFGRLALVPGHSRAVGQALAALIDPALPAKTLVLCWSALHADQVVVALRAALAARYGALRADAVVPITPTSDRPLATLRRFRDEPWPSVAVVTGPLPAGIGVPALRTLVFLRPPHDAAEREALYAAAARPAPGKLGFRVVRVDGAAETSGLQDLGGVVLSEADDAVISITRAFPVGGDAAGHRAALAAQPGLEALRATPLRVTTAAWRAIVAALEEAGFTEASLRVATGVDDALPGLLRGALGVAPCRPHAARVAEALQAARALGGWTLAQEDALRHVAATLARRGVPAVDGAWLEPSAEPSAERLDRTLSGRLHAVLEAMINAAW
ncbi:MAG: DUF4145 domain-containing protein [Alphaproteobacteria bacterium]|nr:DUF4145 domain-containing protein [Alphaproteobacteria bacterium]